MGNLEERSTSAVSPSDNDSGADASLPEFDEFLVQIGYGHMYRLSSDAPPADTDPTAGALPQPPVPAAASAPPVSQRLSHKTTALLLTLGIAAMVASVMWQPIHKALDRARYAHGQTAETAFGASPFFSLERFDSVQPGMQRQHLRNLLGLPIVRRPRPSEPFHEEWCYAAPTNDSLKRVLVCVVVLESGGVVRTKKFFAEDKASFGAAWPGELTVRADGRLRLDWPDGSHDSIDADDVTPTVLLCSVSGVTEKDLSGLPARVYPVHCAVDGPTGTAGPRATVFGSDPQRPLALPPISLYWKGNLYFLPFNLPGVSKNTVRDDLQWFLAHLSALRS